MAKMKKTKEFIELNDLAEDVIVDLRFTRFFYDDQGNDLSMILSEEEIAQRAKAYYDSKNCNILDFTNNEDLKKISFIESLSLPIIDIKEKYLKEILPIARGIMRNDPRFDHGIVASEEVEDSFLDDLLALRWKENLKLWCLRHELENGVVGEKGDEKADNSRRRKFNGVQNR